MLQRMLIEKIENRILVGIIMFVGIMVLVGWVAINENARMQSFQRQYLARSIERGAVLFAANCSTCHGADGRGLVGRGPGLNSPHFFGHDFTASQRSQIAALQNQINALEQERLDLAAELANVTTARREEITARLAEIGELVGSEGIPAQIAALNAEIDDIMAQLLPATLNAYPSAEQLEERPDWVTRLGQAGYSDTLESYIITTLVHGRSQTRFMWGENAMVAWAQEAGGPLRRDQIQDLTNFILNWDKGDDWTIEDALLVNQYALVPSVGGAGGERAAAAGTDVDAILAAWEEEGIVGDPERGKAIYDNRAPSERGELLGCAGCHTGASQGPATELTWSAFFNERINVPSLADYTFERYIVESIVRANDYIVPGWNAGVMPQNFGNRMSIQDLADVTAYLATYGD